MKAVFGDLVYTGKGLLKKAYVVFEKDRVVDVTTSKPDTDVVAEYPVLTPAFIDAHSHIGLERSGEPYEEGETNERMASLITLADALDSVQMDDDAFKDSVEAGVLYSCVLPGSGNIIGGRAVVIRNFAPNTREAFVKYVGVKAAFGHNPRSTTDWKGDRPSTRMGAVMMLRSELIRIKRLLKMVGKKKKEPEEISPEEDVLVDLLQGKEVLRVHCHKEDDLMALLRMRDTFDLKITVEHAANIHRVEPFQLLRERGIPVVYGPLDSFNYKVELKRAHWRNLRALLDSGVQFGLMSDHPVIVQNLLPLTLRYFLWMGMSKEEAVGILTERNARILGLQDLGLLEKGRLASFVGWSGDPFDLTSHPLEVYGEGRRIYEWE